MTLSYEGVEAVLAVDSVIPNLMQLIQIETGPQTIQAVTAVLHNLAVERSSGATVGSRLAVAKPFEKMAVKQPLHMR